MTKEQLKESARPYLESYPNENIFHVTTDGMVFLQSNRSAAVNHANHLKTELVSFTRKDFDESNSDVKVVNISVTPEQIIDQMKKDAKKWKKADLMEFLKSKEIPFNEKDNVNTLYGLVVQYFEAVELQLLKNAEAEKQEANEGDGSGEGEGAGEGTGEGTGEGNQE